MILSRYIKSSIAEKEGFFVDEYFGGHGIGKYLHMKPLITHCKNNMTEVM